MSKGSFKEQVQKKMQSQNTNLSYFSIGEPGEYIFRILQKPHNVEEPAFEQYSIHGNIFHPDFNSYTQFICLGLGCPLCAMHQKIKDSGAPDAWRVAKTAFFYWRVRDNKDGKVKLMKLSLTAQTALVTEMMNMYNQNVNIQDFVHGRDILLTVIKTNGKTHYKFSTLTSYESKKVSEKIIEEVKIWEQYRPLTKLFKLYSMDELTHIVNGQSLKTIHKNNTSEPIKKPSKGALIEEMRKKMDISGITDKRMTEGENGSQAENKSDPANPNEPENEDSDRIKRLRKQN